MNTLYCIKKKMNASNESENKPLFHKEFLQIVQLVS